MSHRAPPPPPHRVPVVFHVGAHRVEVSGGAGVWAVRVNEARLPSTYRCQADAWEAGVREADRLDRTPRG